MGRLSRNRRSLQIAFVAAVIVWHANAMATDTGIPSSNTVSVPLIRATEEMDVDSVVSTFSTRGVVQPAREITVRSPIAARVTNVAVKPGQNVKRDQLLVEFDTTALQRAEDKAAAGSERLAAELAQLHETLKRLREKEKTLREPIGRAKSILDQLDRHALAGPDELGTGRGVIRAPLRDLNRDPVSDSLARALAGHTRLQMEITKLERMGQELQEAAVAASVARETGREALAQFSHVTAPVSGVISACQVNPSERVSAGDELATIIQTNRVKILLWIPRKRLPQEDRTLSASVRQTGMKNSWVTSKELKISNLPHPRTGQFVAELVVDNPASCFQPGQFVEARITQHNAPQPK